MTRTIDEIRQQEQLFISPELIRSPHATVYRSGMRVSVYSYDARYEPAPNVARAGLWLWITLVATAAALWWLARGNEPAVFVVGAAIGLVVYASVHLVREIYRAARKDAGEQTHALSITMGDENAVTFFESPDKVEVDVVRAEIEKVFAGVNGK